VIGHRLHTTFSGGDVEHEGHPPSAAVEGDLLRQASVAPHPPWALKWERGQATYVHTDACSRWSTRASPSSLVCCCPREKFHRLLPPRCQPPREGERAGHPEDCVGTRHGDERGSGGCRSGGSATVACTRSWPSDDDRKSHHLAMALVDASSGREGCAPLGEEEGRPDACLVQQGRREEDASPWLPLGKV
jgi:hypothetical protein